MEQKYTKFAKEKEKQPLLMVGFVRRCLKSPKIIVNGKDKIELDRENRKDTYFVRLPKY
jgi:hypothetical protein